MRGQRDCHPITSLVGGKRWYFRFHIPVELRAAFGGKRELRHSLKTTVYTTAKGLLPGHLYRTDKLFAKLRAAMTDEEIRLLRTSGSCCIPFATPSSLPSTEPMSLKPSLQSLRATHMGTSTGSATGTGSR